ncbi:MAG: cbb3-type cytochrome c oxidase subunit I [Myxococcota bacterium]
MTPTIAQLLALSFLAAVLGLFALVWAIARHQFSDMAAGARVIFRPGEENQVEDPAADSASLQASVSDAEYASDPDEVKLRILADRSARSSVLAFLTSSVVWLMFGSVLGLVVSLKFHFPDWLSGSAWMTFGRLRPLHLNVVAYGWLSMAGIGTALWLLPRTLQTPLRGGSYAAAGAVIWNVGMIAGVTSLFIGATEGLEWLEFPWQVDMFFVIGGALAGVPLLATVRHRTVRHLYVSTWYIAAALIWFPILFLVSNLPRAHSGVEQALVNWWYAHNVLGLWFTPLALAAAYYLIPKIVGRPIYSYQLSLLGFWALALFYSQVGVHHLIGGPVPTWVVTLSIVTSVAMVVPVIAVAINHHMTLLGRFKALLYSPSLRFVVAGAVMYTLASLQGSLSSLRSVNTVTHFTHYTIAHAHLGAYGFASFVFFGAAYFLVPRVTLREWPRRSLIDVHFGLVLAGFAIYFVALTIGGVVQGLQMLDASIPFIDIVVATKPYLWGRSIGGALMVLGHLVFAVHLLWLLLSRRSQRNIDSLELLRKAAPA